MLSISFGINPILHKLERWYTGVSFGLAFGIPIIPASLGHFGPDPVYGNAYFAACELC